MVTFLAVTVFWCILAASITLTITESDLFQPIRSLAFRISPRVASFLRCNFCIGFWVSASLSLIFSPSMYLLGDFIFATLDSINLVYLNLFILINTVFDGFFGTAIIHRFLYTRRS